MYKILDVHVTVYICSSQLLVQIPLVRLKFASSSGLKRIPKKRSLEQDDSYPPNSPNPKRQKKSIPASKVSITLQWYQALPCNSTKR